jgi:predicted ATPase
MFHAVCDTPDRISAQLRCIGSGHMSSRRNRTIKMPAPYLRRLWLDPSRVADSKAYPFCLPFLQDDFELSFDRSITIIVGENGTGKSTLLEGIAVLAGYDEAGGGKGYRPVDHSNALEAMGGELSKALRASWLPKITNGWFFRAESFFSVARYQDQVNLEEILAFFPAPHQTFCRIHTAKASCASSKSAVRSRASSSSMSRSPRCHLHARWNSSS